MPVAPSLRSLAQAAGLAPRWIGSDGKPRRVSDANLAGMLQSLGYPAATAGQRKESASRLADEANAPPALLTADAGAGLDLPASLSGTLALRDEEGKAQVLVKDAQHGFTAPARPGYYTIEHGQGTVTLAVAPVRCFGLGDALATPAPRAWGLAAQVYSLSRRGDGGIGDSRSIAELCARAAPAGAQAVGLSPLHAIGRITERYSPYSPSHRGFLNPWLADPSLVFGEDAVRDALARAGLAERWQRQERAALIDWPVAASLRLALWQALHQGVAGMPVPLRRDFDGFCRAGGDALVAHALIAARQAQAAARGESQSWRDWPGDWRTKAASSALAFADESAGALDLERFMQWAAARSWRKVQAEAGAAGMRVGLIADLAVGFDPGGGEAWSHRDALLDGLVLGAPPDAFNDQGQQWGITSYSPAGLRRHAFAPFLQSLRAGMALGGGIRLDHILGLARLWIVPEGAPAGDGAYLAYPLHDLLRLVALESWRHRCIVIGEDLGTVPPSLRDTLARRGVMGTDVLLFCRDRHGAFVPSAQWRRDAMATTTTHDLPPLMGWRKGIDVATQARLHAWSPPARADAMAARAKEVRRLDRALDRMPADGEHTASKVLDWAALRFVARSAAPLVLIPMEDALGRIEQPNLPGTVDEHPNWRLRLPPLESLGSLELLLHWIADARKEDTNDA